jgi:hypothetical protein
MKLRVVAADIAFEKTKKLYNELIKNLVLYLDKQNMQSN